MLGFRGVCGDGGGGVWDSPLTSTGSPPFSRGSHLLQGYLGSLVDNQSMVTLEETQGISSQLLRPALFVNALCHLGLRAGPGLRDAALGRGIILECLGRSGDISD